MIVLADSSALVKLYADEADQEVIRAIDLFTTAQISRVEVPAALWREHRERELTPRLTRALVVEFEDDWFGDDSGLHRIEAVRMTSLVLEDAARLTGVHGLRGDDAIQLACARAVRGADPPIISFVVFDRDLRAATAAEGFTLVP